MEKILARVGLGIVLMALAISCSLNSNNEKVEYSAQSELNTLKELLYYLENDGIDIDTTDLGIYYITLEEGEGAYPETGDTLTLDYSGYFVTGELFDASALHSEDGKADFVVGDASMIQGWNDGLKEINKNAKVQLIIPSEFAYGSTGNSTVPPYQTIIFIIKVYDIKPA